MKKTDSNRIRIAAGLTAGALAIPAAHFGKEAFKDVDNYSKSNRAQDASYDQLNRPLTTPAELFSRAHVVAGLGEQGIDAAQVTVHKVTGLNATPTSVAEHLHAKNVDMVATEISDQVGGEHSLQDGEFVAVANDQLNQTKPAK